MKGLVACSSRIVEGTVLHRFVLRLHVGRELQVADGVLVSAEYPGVIGKAAELLHQGGEHHLGVPLEEAATSRREESVSREHSLRIVEDVGDVAPGVGGDVKNPGALLTDLDRISLLQAVGKAGEAARIGVMSEDGHVVELGEGGVRHAVIGVVVGGEQLGDPSGLGLHPRHHRFGLGRVDHGGIAAGLADHQIRVVVLECRDALDSKAHAEAS
jgi:hypothetical protein